jgi:hypothetical protein
MSFDGRRTWMAGAAGIGAAEAEPLDCGLFARQVTIRR